MDENALKSFTRIIQCRVWNFGLTWGICILIGTVPSDNERTCDFSPNSNHSFSSVQSFQFVCFEWSRQLRSNWHIILTRYSGFDSQSWPINRRQKNGWNFFIFHRQNSVLSPQTYPILMCKFLTEKRAFKSSNSVNNAN